MNKKVNSPSASWVFVGKNKISRGKFSFLDTDSKSAIFQKNLAQRRDAEHLVKRWWASCEGSRHNQDNNMEDASEKFKWSFHEMWEQGKTNCLLNYYITFM